MFESRWPKYAFLFCLTLLAFGACSDDDAPSKDHDDDHSKDETDAGSKADSGNAGDGKGTKSAVYALANTVTTADDATTYVHVLSSLDVKDRIEGDDAREYGGYATIAAQGGGLFISSAESPKIQRYTVGDDLKLTEGDEVDFSSYGLMNAAFYTNVFVSDTKAYMNRDQVERVVWSPKDMTIKGPAPDSGVDTKDGSLITFAAYDRGIAVSEGRVYQPFYFHDKDFYQVAPNSKIVIYGSDDKPEKTLDVDCPALDTVTKDADGNLIFSTWAGTVAYRLTGKDAAKSCAVQIDAGKTEVKETIHFEELTDGRETAMYRYMKDGIGTLAVYNTDDLDLDKVEEPLDLNQAARWELWRVDLEKKTAQPIGGLPKFSGGYYSFTIDGRTLVLLPSANLSSTTIYEVKPEGDAEELFETSGWTYQLLRVR